MRSDGTLRTRSLCRFARWGAAIGLLLAFCLAACEKKEVDDRLYFADLKPPLGVKVKVVSDVSRNPESGGEMEVVTEVAPDVDKDELDRLLRTFWRQVKGRFHKFRGGKPAKVDLRFYPDGKGQAGGADFLAQVLWMSSQEEPTFTNRQKAPLLKWAKKALGKQPQFTAQLAPQILGDPTTMELEIKVPFVKADGTGQYVDKLTYTRATTEFSSYVRTLFDKIEGLRKVTFEGLHNDKTVMRVWLTRKQYEQLNLRQVEESLGAYQGKFIELLMSKKITSEKVEKKVAKERRKVYRETFARLPKEQVELSKELN